MIGLVDNAGDAGKWSWREHDHEEGEISASKAKVQGL